MICGAEGRLSTTGEDMQRLGEEARLAKELPERGIRQCWVISEPGYLDYLRGLRWLGLRTIAMVVREWCNGAERMGKVR